MFFTDIPLSLRSVPPSKGDWKCIASLDAIALFGLVDVGDSSSPVFVDIDGDQDAFIGTGGFSSGSGNTLFFENTASVGATAQVRAGVEAPAQAAEVPEDYVLASTYPNPFNPETAIRYGLPEALSVKMVIYDALGRQVRVLVEGEQAAGWHDVVFEAGSLPSGMYVYRLETPEGDLVQTMLLLK